MSKLDVTKKHYSKLKDMSKITNIPSEIRNFFNKKTCKSSQKACKSLDSLKCYMKYYNNKYKRSFCIDVLCAGC